MKGIIDRFENGFAVLELEDGNMANLPVLLVPGAKEGDVVRITLDAEETNARRARIQKKMEELWEPDA